MFARMIGQAPSTTPYPSQQTTPALKIPNIKPEMSCVERVRQIRTTWGRNATVVSVPATTPSELIQSIMERIEESMARRRAPAGVGHKRVIEHLRNNYAALVTI